MWHAQLTNAVLVRTQVRLTRMLSSGHIKSVLQSLRSTFARSEELKAANKVRVLWPPSNAYLPAIMVRALRQGRPALALPFYFQSIQSAAFLRVGCGLIGMVTPRCLTNARVLPTHLSCAPPAGAGQ